MTGKDIDILLLEEAARINTPAFIADDPVQFPRRFDDLRDIEVSALLVASISWGKRSMILRDAERLLALMDQQPYRYMMEEGYEDLDPAQNIHRTFFARDLQWYLRGLREIYRQHSTLNDFADSRQVGKTEAQAWQLAADMRGVIEAANDGKTCPQCLPTNLSTTALKRLNMALRWLVRNDGIVDMGVWNCIKPEQLYIPLDVHVGNTARALGMLTRKANDRKSCEILTERARSIKPEDPALLDFALFGLGVTGAINKNESITLTDK